MSKVKHIISVKLKNQMYDNTFKEIQKFKEIKEILFPNETT